ncbi:MAG: hypothetical protein HYT48_01260 [Candidatus Vogelbacteria bacterium]|nr:hypothetical protein [Candidatus Vogelbacteria bacterium]
MTESAPDRLRELEKLARQFGFSGAIGELLGAKIMFFGDGDDAELTVAGIVTGFTLNGDELWLSIQAPPFRITFEDENMIEVIPGELGWSYSRWILWVTGDNYSDEIRGTAVFLD